MTEKSLDCRNGVLEMVSKSLIENGSTTRKIGVDKEILDGHAMRTIIRKQIEFRSLEKDQPTAQAVEAFQRKPYSTGKEEK
jgi:hypothetical protein